MKPLLELKELSVGFHSRRKELQILHTISLGLGAGEILGLVGESGSGKSLTCLAIMGLLAENAKISGQINYGGRDILSMAKSEMAMLRGRDIAMIFQDPIGALNPVQTIGKQVMEAIRINSNKKSCRNAIRQTAVDLLEEVGIPDPADRLSKFPHELSGGQNQRIMIAMMLAGNPKILIADEPTTALDVTIQAQILRLLVRLRNERQMAIILVTHDLGVVAQSCDRMAVMYCGRIVESGFVSEVFHSPAHHYTRGLLSSRPRIDQEIKRLCPIPGSVPMPAELPPGCSFAPRCPAKKTRCNTEIPILDTAFNRRRNLACHYPIVSQLSQEGS